MLDTEVSLTLGERARAAYEHLMEERAQEEEKRRREHKEWTLEQFKGAVKKVLDVDIEPLEPRAVIDGLTFAMRPSDHYSYRANPLCLVRHCAQCGQEAWSQLYDLTSLGEALAHEADCRDWEHHQELAKAAYILARGSLEEQGFVPVDKIPEKPTALEALGQALIDYLIDQGVQISNAEYE